MVIKLIKNAFLAGIVSAVVCAGTVSARQLRTPTGILPVCRGTCSAKVPCNGPCICEILTGTTGGCVRDPGPAQPR
ncbi:MAG TPA: hypothetical protein VKH81_12390 [Candidatus Angelobacter sp.]|nr:hypothetical protein [Candidatus Angelobacter sp.]